MTQHHAVYNPQKHTSDLSEGSVTHADNSCPERDAIREHTAECEQQNAESAVSQNKDRRGECLFREDAGVDASCKKSQRDA